MPEEAPRTGPFEEVVLLEIASPARALTEDLAARLSRLLEAPCRIRAAPDELQVPELPSRNQIDADRLLAGLEALDAPSEVVLVGLTGRDIGHPIFTHFFGRARRGGRAVLVSTARLDPGFYGLAAEPALTLHRATVEVLHELGHAAGLDHCPRWDCVMHFAATVEDLDLRGEAYCAVCARTLPPPLTRHAAR